MRKAFKCQKIVLLFGLVSCSLSANAEIIKPSPLKVGDTIVIVAPAGPLADQGKFLRGVKELEEAGFKIKVDPQVYFRDGYFAGSDQQRAEALQRAFEDPEAKAVFCAKGGYGSARLLSLLDLDKMAKSGKMFVGYSDITALHLALNKRGLATIHGLMPALLNGFKTSWVRESFFNLLKGDAKVPENAPVGEVLVSGTAIAPVVGGCLRLITDSLGTPNEMDCAGKILLLEDTGEKPYRIDAMLTHLLNANKIQKCAGIVIGDLSHGVPEKSKPSTDPNVRTWRDIVKDRLSGLGIPIMVNYPFGHISNVLSLPLGVSARLDADKGTLTFLESACKEDSENRSL